MPEIWSPSRPWHGLHCGPYTRLPAAMSSCAVLARVILGEQLRGPGGARQRDRRARPRARPKRSAVSTSAAPPLPAPQASVIPVAVERQDTTPGANSIWRRSCCDAGRELNSVNRRAPSGIYGVWVLCRRVSPLLGGHRWVEPLRFWRRRWPHVSRAARANHRPRDPNQAPPRSHLHPLRPWVSMRQMKSLGISRFWTRAHGRWSPPCRLGNVLAGSRSAPIGRPCTWRSVVRPTPVLASTKRPCRLPTGLPMASASSTWSSSGC